MRSKLRVTFRDIAKAAGVAPSTVSLALRNSQRISLEARERIRAVAESLGYQPNPLLAIYQASVRASKPQEYQATLAWIDDSPDEHKWARPWMKPLLEGARERASVLGYRLDEIRLPHLNPQEAMENFRRWERILRARQIYGVILPWMELRQHIQLPWEGFSVVCVGKYRVLNEGTSTELTGQHHYVSSDDALNLLTALLRLRESGCRRIGLAISTYNDAETDKAYSAVFVRECLDWPSEEVIPILYSDHVPDLLPWVRHYRPDAIICGHSGVRPGLEAAGYKIPGDFRLVHLNIAPDVADWTGIDRRLDCIASAAIDLLSAHMIRNETGVPPFAKGVSIKGVWAEGQT